MGSEELALKAEIIRGSRTSFNDYAWPGDLWAGDLDARESSEELLPAARNTLPGLL